MARYHFLSTVRTQLVGGLTDAQLIRPGGQVRVFPLNYVSAAGEITDTDGNALVASGYAEVVTDAQALAAAWLTTSNPAVIAPDLLIAGGKTFADPREVGPLTGPAGTRPQRISHLSGTDRPILQGSEGPVALPAGADDWGDGAPDSRHQLNSLGTVTLMVTCPATAVHAVNFAVTVKAVDAEGGIVPGYVGTIHFTGDAGQSGLADYTFVGGDNGVHVFAAAQFAAAGLAKKITATDTTTFASGTAQIDIT